jgi:paired amphipathic helix protein Sin3a
VQEINVECSGRDEMCKSVLNDEWVSHPSFSSEDSVFMAHKKNLYEEALHRTEEERHEYDFHIDALMRTIGLLEPLNQKISGMTPEERALFRLKSNFGGAGKAVHQRIIKKIYGREAGIEVLQAMQDTPALALPVVLTRLKQKEGEWKRAQREWNKIWRAVDAANYARSLDHQGITFKTADKKSLTAKAFVAQIEAFMETQMARRAALVDPLYAPSTNFRTKSRTRMCFVTPSNLRSLTSRVSAVPSSASMRLGRAGLRLGCIASSARFSSLMTGTSGPLRVGHVGTGRTRRNQMRTRRAWRHRIRRRRQVSKGRPV